MEEKEKLDQETSEAEETAEEIIEEAAAQEREEVKEETSDTEDSQEEGTEEEDTEEGASPKSWAEKRAAKKAAKSDKKADANKEKIEELEDRIKRQMAEFENFRKRTEKEKQSMFETGAKSVLEKILPVIDNFERGLSGMTQEQLADPFVDGMNKVYRQMLDEFSKIDVKPIEAVGQEFDPNYHNAVMQVATQEFESGVVAQEFLKGYTYRDSVLRHSMVAVAE